MMLHRNVKTRDQLIEAIRKMVGHQTWADTSANYAAAELAVQLTEQFYGINPDNVVGPLDEYRGQ